MKIEVSGHTNKRRTDGSNLERLKKLSQKRADKIKDYLMKEPNNIAGNRITALGWYDAKPTRFDGWIRRVEFKRIS